MTDTTADTNVNTEEIMTALPYDLITESVDPRKAVTAAQALTVAAAGNPDVGFWWQRAAAPIAALLHAAALDGLTITDVRDWARSGDYVAAIQILEREATTAQAMCSALRRDTNKDHKAGAATRAVVAAAVNITG